MPNFEIRPLNEDELSLWDDFVGESPQGALFHKSFWLKASGRKFVIYGYFKGGELYAGIPLVCSAKLGIKLASHPPLTPYLGVLFKRQDTKYVSRISQEKEMSQEIARRLKGQFHLVNFQFPPGSVDLQPFIWEGFVAGIRYTYIIDLNDSLESVWKGMEDKRRNDIRRAEKDGIGVVPSDDFEQTLNLVGETFTRQGITASFKSAALNYNEVLTQRNQCKSFLAKDKDGNSIAAVYIVWDNKSGYYLLGGYHSQKSHHGASALAMWEAIKFAKEELGLGAFDFEGSMVPHVELFFRKFGGEQTPYYTVSWVKPYLNLPRFASRVGDFILSRL